MKILYITYTSMERMQSGSEVRPCKMYDAFKDEGHEVFLLSGAQSFSNLLERYKAIRKISNDLRRFHFDLCYIESSTYPIIMYSDIRLIKRICRRGIPTAFFYRDYYRKFPDLFPRRMGILNSIKETLLDLLQKRMDKALSVVDIVYFPSSEARDLFSYRNMHLLPPAGEDCIPNENSGNSNTAIYVGGITSHYGADILLDAFEYLNCSTVKYRLILVCRDNEWQMFEHSSKNADWLEVYHESGSNLARYYVQASVAVIPKRPNAYNDLAISVKLYEYMSYGLPVVVINSKATNRIIYQYNIGIITEDSAFELAKGIETILSDSTVYNHYRNNVIDSLRKENLWIHRVRQIIKDLCGV